jgi:hypothetical protein
MDQRYFVDYADYGGVDRGVGAADGGHGAKPFGGKQYALSDSGVRGIERENCFAAIGAVEIQRLYEQNLSTVVRWIFLSSDDITDDSRDQHSGIPGFRRDVDFFDDAYDRRVSGRFDGKKREAGFFSSAPIDGFTCSGTHRIERDDRFTFIAAVAVNRLHDEQALADECFVFHGGNDFADDAAENH